MTFFRQTPWGEGEQVSGRQHPNGCAAATPLSWLEAAPRAKTPCGIQSACDNFLTHLKAALLAFSLAEHPGQPELFPQSIK